MLQYSEVLSYTALGDFDLLKHSRHDVLARPWSNTMHRQLAVKYFKLLRAHEEIYRLNVEVRRLQAWIDHETAQIKQIAAGLSAQDPLLSAELQVFFSFLFFKIDPVYIKYFGTSGLIPSSTTYQYSTSTMAATYL